jgi:hypothetical protein
MVVRDTSREWLKYWANEILNMGWISRVPLFIELPPVVAVDKQTQGTFQGMRATREASRRSCQTCQVVPQLGVVSFHRIGIGFAFRDFISTPVIPQAVIGLKGVTEILLGLGRIVYHLLNGWLSTLPNHFPPQIAARLSIYEREDVDPVFLWPIKVNNSSISAVLTSVGTGTSDMLAALAWTHNETVR